MWKLDEAIQLINKISYPVNIYDYYIGLTGSVLYKGESTNDLDLIFYPKNNCHEDYRPVLAVLERELQLTKIEVFSFEKNPDHKLVFVGWDGTGKKYNFFFPNFSWAGRLPDKYGIAPITPNTKSS